MAGAAIATVATAAATAATSAVAVVAEVALHHTILNSILRVLNRFHLVFYHH